MVLGKGSGKNSILWKLKQLGITTTDEQVATITARVKEEAERTKSVVSDQIFEDICRNVIETM